MKQRITLNTFRKVSAAEDAMARAMMSRTAAADPAPVQFAQERSAVVASVGGTRLARKSAASLTYTMAELGGAR